MQSKNKKKRHLLEVARSLKLTTHVPKQFWGEAVLIATFLINKMPSHVLHFQTPCNSLLKVYSHTRLLIDIPLNIFWCIVFVHIHSHLRSKLDPKAIKCIFLGYSSIQKGYRCYSPITRKFYLSLDVTFFEDQAYYPKSDIQGENPITKEYLLWNNNLEKPICSSKTIPVRAPISIPRPVPELVLPEPVTSNEPVVPEPDTSNNIPDLS